MRGWGGQVGTVMPGRYKHAVQFPAPCPNCEGVDWNGYAVKDLVRTGLGRIVALYYRASTLHPIYEQIRCLCL